MANVDSYTDEQLKEALIKTNGQPTKAAEMLKVTYISVYGRIRRNPDLLDVQKSARQKIFQDLNNFTISAVLAGVMKSPKRDDEGEIMRNADGSIIYEDAVVGVGSRMEYASRLMNLFKSDEGIKDESVVEVKNTLDVTKLSDSALDELEKALKGDEE
ncbi:hypothetical protein [Elizabethkingia miricola]|uniref:Terminase n=1 Tax=Elizabethkingia miricola TaxID=172045 RepID=A0ABD5B4R1_ELIMR|nr:hypothetical protein [Elizabethkingia miricola]MDQ8748379.1 hypothetical protein [Elizabethkingia miricola]